MSALLVVVAAKGLGEFPSVETASQIAKLLVGCQVISDMMADELRLCASPWTSVVATASYAVTATVANNETSKWLLFISPWRQISVETARLRTVLVMSNMMKGVVEGFTL